MRIVMVARVPGWYSFHQDRLARRFQAEGHEVVAIVVEKTGTLASLREWIHKLGPRVVIQKIFKRLVNRRSSEQAQTNGVRRVVNYPPCKARVYCIASHNSDECLKIVGELQPEVLVLRGCLIVRRGVLQIPKFGAINPRSEEHTSELQSHSDLVCRLLLEKKNQQQLTKTTDRERRLETRGRV